MSCLYAITNEPALELGCGGEDVHDELTRRLRGIDVDIEYHDAPRTLPCTVKQLSEVSDRAGESVELGDHQNIGLSVVQHPKCLDESGPGPHRLSADSSAQ